MCAFSVTQSRPTLLQPYGLWSHQAPLSVEFSRQEYWSGLPFPPPGVLPTPGNELTALASPALAGSLPLATWGARLYGPTREAPQGPAGGEANFHQVMGCKWSPEGNGAFALRICRLVHPNSRSRQAEARIMVNSGPRTGTRGMLQTWRYGLWALQFLSEHLEKT